MKKTIEIEDVRNCFQMQIEHLKRRCADWEGNIDSIITEYCRADRIKSDTSLTNVSNIVSHAGEIKALKTAIENLEEVLRFIERFPTEGD